VLRLGCKIEGKAKVFEAFKNLPFFLRLPALEALNGVAVS
jgi:hypothetical protein